MELLGKVAVVTGGAVRVGRAITLALAEAGCHVFIVYGKSSKSAEETRKAAVDKGVQARIFAANLAVPQSAQSVISAAVAWLGQADILVNSAAVFRQGMLDDTTLADWDLQFAVNLRAPFLLSQAFARQIPMDGQGAVVNISDARVFRPAPDHFAYRLTKSGLLEMTEILAHDLAPRIRVNALALGAILPPPGEDEGYLETLAKNKIPLRQPGNATIVAQNVIHLLEQDFLTGVTIKVDGGEYL
jgi:NAD(P)-dependent dehydrogenase (short-subunit alcohol dehydrogenase family)